MVSIQGTVCLPQRQQRCEATSICLWLSQGRCGNVVNLRCVRVRPRSFFICNMSDQASQLNEHKFTKMQKLRFQTPTHDVSGSAAWRAYGASRLSPRASLCRVCRVGTPLAALTSANWPGPFLGQAGRAKCVSRKKLWAGLGGRRASSSCAERSNRMGHGLTARKEEMCDDSPDRNGHASLSLRASIPPAARAECSTVSHLSPIDPPVDVACVGHAVQQARVICRVVSSWFD